MNETLKILVVDDEAPVRKFLQEILQHEGFHVTTAKDGLTALEKFEQDTYPIVFTDIYMPGMSGIKLLERIKQSHKATQVIIMTEYASTDSAIATLRAGAYDYIMKPFEDVHVVCSTAHHAAQKVELENKSKHLVEMLKKKTVSLVAANANLRKLATHDALTGLYNHRYFQERLLSEIRRAERYHKAFSLLFIDLDYFKIYNDANGHLQGDQLLRNISKVLKDSFRQTDIVARYGGDEFVVILPETTGRMARPLAEKVEKRIREFDFAKMDVMPEKCVTVSIGCATYMQDGVNANALISAADKAMYQAKKKSLVKKDPARHPAMDDHR